MEKLIKPAIVHLLQFISKVVVGASLEEGNFDEEIDSQPAQKEGGAAGQNYYEIIGTLSDPSKPKPEWVADTVAVSLRSARSVLNAARRLVIALRPSRPPLASGGPRAHPPHV